MSKNTPKIYTIEEHHQFIQTRKKAAETHLDIQKDNLLDYIEEKQILPLFYGVKLLLEAEKKKHALGLYNDRTSNYGKDLWTFNGSIDGGVILPAGFLEIGEKIKTQIQKAEKIITGLQEIQRNGGTILSLEFAEEWLKEIDYFRDQSDCPYIVQTSSVSPKEDFPKSRHKSAAESGDNPHANKSYHDLIRGISLVDVCIYQLDLIKEIDQCDAWLRLYHAMASPPITQDALGDLTKILPSMGVIKVDSRYIGVTPPYGKSLLESLLNPALWQGTEAHAIEFIQKLPVDSRTQLGDGIHAHYSKTIAAGNTTGAAALRDAAKAASAANGME